MSQLSFNSYAKQVVSQLGCSKYTKKRIKEDIIEMLTDKSEDQNCMDPVVLLGSVQDMVGEFADNLESYTTKYQYIYVNKKSSKTILGLPLYHITNNQQVTAKGIIAIGQKAVGIISIGAISAGVISFGGISIGVFSLGGLAIGALCSIGGVAIAGDTAIGGLAVAYSLAIGGLAIAKNIAIGGVTHGLLMGYRQSYIQPGGVDDGVFRAYKIPVYIKDMRNAAEDMSFHIGFIKKWVLDMVTSGINNSH